MNEEEILLKYKLKTLRGANLRGANLTGAVLRGADLTDTDLIGANLEVADLTGTDLRGANLEGVNLENAVLTYADLKGVNLEGANLAYADLRDIDLTHAILIGADLRDADLENAILRGANLAHAILIGANISIPTINKQQIFYKTFNDYYKAPEKWVITENSIIEDTTLNTDLRETCASGINIASLEWVKTNCKNQIWEVELLPESVVVVPYASDGKFRTNKIRLIKKYEP